MQCHAKLAMLLTMSLVCSALVCFIDTWIIYIDNQVFIILIWWSKWTLLSIRSGGRGVAITTGRVTQSPTLRTGTSVTCSPTPKHHVCESRLYGHVVGLYGHVVCCRTQLGILTRFATKSPRLRLLYIWCASHHVFMKMTWGIESGATIRHFWETRVKGRAIRCATTWGIESGGTIRHFWETRVKGRAIRCATKSTPEEKNPPREWSRSLLCKRNLNEFHHRTNNLAQFL